MWTVIKASFTITVIMTVPAVVAPAAAQSNPYRRVEAPRPPADMNNGEWGELIRVKVDTEGNVWVLHRCFKAVLGDPRVSPGHSDGIQADCLGPWAAHPPVLKFSSSGELIASMGTGMFGRPHGFDVDEEGNVWVGDVAVVPDEMGATVIKLSPTGEVLMTLGTPGVVGESPDTFNRPSGVAVGPNGDIFVSDGEGPNNRVVKYSREGRFITAWGTTGAEPGNFDTPHDIAVDSRGRVFVADRSNNRVQIFDGDGNFLDSWTQFGRPSGISINRETDMLYTTDSHSNARVNPGFQRGIYIGSAITGEVMYFIPDPDLDKADDTRISGASGVASDATDSAVYAADVSAIQLRKYVRP